MHGGGGGFDRCKGCKEGIEWLHRGAHGVTARCMEGAQSGMVPLLGAWGGGGMQRVCGGVWMVAVIAFFASVFISLLMICNNYELAKNKSQLNSINYIEQ